MKSSQHGYYKDKSYQYEWHHIQDHISMSESNIMSYQQFMYNIVHDITSYKTLTHNPFPRPTSAMLI